MKQQVLKQLLIKLGLNEQEADKTMTLSMQMLAEREYNNSLEKPNNLEELEEVVSGFDVELFKKQLTTKYNN